jgi:hypothetical protein
MGCCERSRRFKGVVLVNKMDVDERILKSIGRLFGCRKEGAYIRIRTPYLYPDGDVIDLYCLDSGDQLEVTDLGETSRWLRTQTLDVRRSAQEAALIADICVNYGVEWSNGMLQAQVRSVDDLGDAVVRVAQAAIRVADGRLAFLARSVE